MTGTGKPGSLSFKCVAIDTLNSVPFLSTTGAMRRINFAV